MKRERKDAETASPSNPTKTPDTVASIGFATIQESLDLKNEMDTYIKDLQKWKADYAEKEKAMSAKTTKKKIPKHVQQQAGTQESAGMIIERMEKETAEVGRICEKEAQVISENKAKMQAIQKQNAELNKKLGASQINLESKNMAKEILRPLEDLQSQLKFSNDELMSMIRLEDEKFAKLTATSSGDKKKKPSGSKATKEKLKEERRKEAKKKSKKDDEETVETQKVSKILADLDKEMKELDSLLK